VLVPCLALIAAGLTCLCFGGTIGWLLTSAVVFGTGFGTAYPVFVAHVMNHVGPERRGAAFGAILAAFDTGIGTGSTLMGWIIGSYGFVAAFGTAAALSALSIPYLLATDGLLRVAARKGRPT
jgi:MFS family permease